MAHEHHVVGEVHRVVLGERAAHAEAVQDLHGLDVLDLHLAGNRDAAGGEQAVAEDDRADGVLVLRVAGPHVVVGHRSQTVALHQPVEGHRGARRPLELLCRAVGLDVEGVPEARDAVADLGRGHLRPKRRQLVHLDDLDVAAEARALLREVGVDVEHAAVVVAHDAEAVVLHHVADPGRVDPARDLVPRQGIVVQHPRDLVEGDPRAPEDVGDLRHRAGLAVGQPLAGHAGAVAEGVEPRVVDGGARREVEDDDRHPGPAHHGEHGGRERVGGDVEEDEVHVLLAEAVPGHRCLLRRVDEAQVHDLDTGPLQLVRHLARGSPSSRSSRPANCGQ